MSRLEALDVSYCNFWAKGCRAIVKAAMDSPYIRALSLAGNDAGFPVCELVTELLARNQ